DATYWDLDRRVRAMDKAGVQIHALSLTTPMVHWARGDVARRAAEAVNDAMAEAHRAYSERFVGCATLPMHEPALAQAELERGARPRPAALRALPPPLRLRHDQPLGGRPPLSHRDGRRGSRHARQRLLLRHGLRPPARHHHQACAAREGGPGAGPRRQRPPAPPALVTAEFRITQAFNGLSYGALLSLLASGLSLIFGVMRI